MDCAHCKTKNSVELVKGVEPYSCDHYACGECNSTFAMDCGHDGCSECAEEASYAASKGLGW